MFEIILKKLSEASTYKGLTIILATVGINLEPALTNQIILVATSIFGLIEIIRKEG